MGSKERGSGRRERSKDLKRDRSEEKGQMRGAPGGKGQMREGLVGERGQTKEVRAKGTNLRRKPRVVKSLRRKGLQGERGRQRRVLEGEGVLPHLPPLKTVAESLVVGRRLTLIKWIKSPQFGEFGSKEEQFGST